jgi:hypothetical protein
MRGPKPSNESFFSAAELKHMLEQTMTRFENWRVEVERNPNPMMVHTLKNIISIIDTVSTVTQAKMDYSYKKVSLKMAALVHQTAHLNMEIARALENDDFIDAEDQKKITKALVDLVNSAFVLIRTVQEGFGSRDLLDTDIRKAIPIAPAGEIEAGETPDRG